MPNRNKKRGYELEAETVTFWKKHGVTARRVLSSGAYKHIGPELSGDLYIEGFKVEAKRKKSGYKFLYDALEQDDCDMLVVRQDKARRLYVLEEDTLLALMRQAGMATP